MENTQKPRLITRLLALVGRHILFRVKYKNREVLDKYDSYVIVPNHACSFDPVFVFPTQFDRDVCIAAKKELFENAAFRWLAKQFNVFAVDREAADIRSLLKSIDFFKKNLKTKLILFPEGKVVVDEEEVGKIYRKGAAFIAYHLEKPLIPVYISMRPKLFRRVNVIFGEPFFISKENFKGKDRFDEASRKIISEIYELRNFERSAI